MEGEVRDKWRTVVATASGDVRRVRDMAWAQWRMAVAPPSQSTSRPRECAHLLCETAPLAWMWRGCGVAFHPAASQSASLFLALIFCAIGGPFATLHTTAFSRYVLY